MLQDIFASRYPSVKGAKVVVDLSTGRPKGYGFVRFGDENDRSQALTEMNGVCCSSRPMLVGVATPKKPSVQQQYSSQAVVFSGGYAPNGAVRQSVSDSPNTTIFVGGPDSDVTDAELKQSFTPFGDILSVKIPAGKGCGFVQFANRSNAEEAIQRLSGTIIGKQTVRLFWDQNMVNKQETMLQQSINSLVSLKDLGYLVGTINDGLQLYNDSTLSLHAFSDTSLNLQAFSDADWAGDKDTLCSTGAYVVYLGKNPISLISKKQRTVARSSTEAEYRSVANTAAEVNFICYLLTDLGISLPYCPVIYCDNIGATQLCSNRIFHSRMKHVAIDFHLIRDQVQNGALRMAHVSSEDQLADALTKPLSRQRFLQLKNKIVLLSRAPS